jgi:hypothetical protein
VTGVLRVPRRAALAAIALLVAAASLTSFAESYRWLWLWAQHHGLHGVWAVAWPLQIDTFIGVGELALFVALADSWPARSRVAAWGVTVLGLAVSVAGNVGHVAGHDLASRATAAVPPLAAAAALAVGLGVLKRVVGAHVTESLSVTSASVEETIFSTPAPAALANGHAAPAGDLRPPSGSPPSWRPGPSRASARSAERCTSASRRHRRCTRTWPRSPVPVTRLAPGRPGRNPPGARFLPSRQEETSMTDQHAERDPNAEVAIPEPPELLAVPADTSYEIELDERPERPAAPVYADISPPEGARLPVIPAHLQTLEGLKAAGRRHAGRQAHRAAYHGVRAPKYLAVALWWAVVGVFRIIGRQIHWWWHLEAHSLRSQA